MDHQLPTELWCDIIRRATVLHGAFDTSYASPFEFNSRLQHEWSFLSSYAANLKHKMVLFNVCVAWRDYIAPLIFEVVVLTNQNYSAVLNSLINEVESSTEFPIRRLDVYISGMSEDLNHSISRDIMAVVKRCPQLKIYRHVDGSDYLIQQDLVEILLSHCRNSLRQVELHGFRLPSNIRDLLATMPQLEILSITASSFENAGVITEGVPTLPTLHTLGIDGINMPEWRNAVLDGSYPQLRSLISRAYPEVPQDYFSLAAVPSSLKVLDICRCLTPPLARFLSSYPSLETLIMPINYQPDEEVIEGLNAPPSLVRQLGIYCLPDAGKEKYTGALVLSHLWIILEVFTGSTMFSKLQHVRLFGFDDYHDATFVWFGELVPVWDQLVPKLQALHIRLDDQNGDPIRGLA